jgi:hypothetical protein
MITTRASVLSSVNSTKDVSSITTALDSGNSVDSSSSSSDSDGESEVSLKDEVKEIRTTLQKRDWRPASTFHLKKRSEMTWAEALCQLAVTPPSIHGKLFSRS